MFGNKKKLGSSFSVMLAEEVLRAQLTKLYSQDIKLFQRDIEAPVPKPVKRGSATISLPEMLALAQDHMTGQVTERQVSISAIIGPFERAFPDAPADDPRRNLRRVEAVCRLYNIQTGCVWWQVHFLQFTVTDELGRIMNVEQYDYTGGSISGEGSEATSVNPCQDMVDSQVVANYPGIHRRVHGLK